MKKKKMIKRIEEICDILKNKQDIIKSFRKQDKYNSIKYLFYSDKKKRYLSNEKIKIQWKFYTRLDIMNRLTLLVTKYYTLNELEYMGIELILASELNKYSCEKLETYYINVVKTIECNLRKWMTICKMYIDIEINYLKCCKDIIENKNTVLSLKNFSIYIV
jgi:hypothetical protein